MTRLVTRTSATQRLQMTPTARLVIACAAIVLVGALPAGAEAAGQARASGADLSGVVRDESGGVIVGASVVATHAATGVDRTVTTDGAGRYVLQALRVGQYDVTASSDGFADSIVRGVRLSLGASVELDLELAIRGATDEVVVAAVPRPVDVRRTGLLATVSSDEIETLPIDRRNFISFSLITPAITGDQTPQQGASRTSGLSFVGQQARSNNVMVDGLDNNDETVGSVRAVFGQDAVQEFQVLSSGYSAEFGNAAGGVVNIVTRSGTNEHRGTAFVLFRDKALNARGHFERFAPDGRPVDRAKAPFRQRQAGGSFGGPLSRNRTFYFGSIERLDSDESNLVTIDDTTPVPHPVEPALSLGTPAEILRRAGFPVEPGNAPFAVRGTQVLGKVDHAPTAGSHLAVRVNTAVESNENIEPFGGLVARSRGAVLESRDVMVAASLTTARSSTTVNELRGQVARRDQDVFSLDPTCDGRCDLEDEGGPTLEVTGFASVGRQRFTPTPRDNVRYQIVNTLSRQAGDHLVKAGIDVNVVDGLRQSLPLHFGGRYIFAQELRLPLVRGLPAVPVSAIQAVALGLPAAYVQGYGRSGEAYDYADLALFVQDDWRPGRGLTVQAGLRYQRQFWPDVQFDVAGYPGRYGFPADRNNLAPRLAVAFDPTGDATTVLRAAYGVFHDNLITSVAGISDAIDGRDDVRTLVLIAPGAFAAWAAPGRRLPEATATALAGGSFPSVQIPIDPSLKTPFTHQLTAGVERELPGGLSVGASLVYARGFDYLGTIDFNPVVPALGAVPGVGFVRRPEDVNGVPGTSASILQYTSFGETWYRGMTLTLGRRLRSGAQFRVSYTLSKSEDNSTDFQSAFIPQDNGRGRNPDDPNGLPLGFDPDAERGPSLEDQRHRLVMSGTARLPAEVQVSAIVIVASGRPYNILAGADLNRDGNGGTFPPDRARRDPANPRTSLPRNSGRLPSQATIDVRVSREFGLGGDVRLEALVEVFNLLNRTNFTDVQNVFGVGAFPQEGVPTFGQFTRAGAPRQAQVGLRLRY